MESNYIKAVYRARDLFLGYDQEKIAEKFGLEKDDDYLYLTYVKTPVRIRRKDGCLETACGTDVDGSLQYEESLRFGTVYSVYDLLCLSANEPLQPFTDTWKRIEGFVTVGTTPQANTFTAPYERKFSGKKELLDAACRNLGAIPLKAYAGADLSFEIPIVPYFSVRLQFWDADDEFPAQIVLLWNSVTLNYMHYETTFYLQGDLLDMIEEEFQKLLDDGSAAGSCGYFH